MLSLGKRSSKPRALTGLRLRIVETESRFSLRDRDLTRDFGDVLVELSPDIIVVAEDESLLQLEPDGNNVFGVLLRESVGLVDFELVFEEELLVI